MPGGELSPVEPLHVAPRPCVTCPYRRDTPPGIWAPEEYEKLARYDDERVLALFLCHQTNATGTPTACRGWLTVHQESVAARLAVLHGRVTDDQRYAEVDVELYVTGTEARDAGLAGVKRPDEAAQRAMDKLVARGAGRR